MTMAHCQSLHPSCAEKAADHFQRMMDAEIGKAGLQNSVASFVDEVMIHGDPSLVDEVMIHPL